MNVWRANIMLEINAKGLGYKELNKKIREVAAKGGKEVALKNVNGQRYIGDGIKAKTTITIEGVPGNDLGAFMDGLEIIVKNNAQDGVGNTMNSGKIVVHGNAGDVLGYGMRGGRIFVRGCVGYRAGIHMKSFGENKPVIVVGERSGDFLGEYMAGGVIVLLGLKGDKDRELTGDYVGTGMHGGVIYVRGAVDKTLLGKEVEAAELSGEDNVFLEKVLREYCDDFGLDYGKLMEPEFIKLYPHSSRPYGRLYTY